MTLQACQNIAVININMFFISWELGSAWLLEVAKEKHIVIYNAWLTKLEKTLDF